MASQWIRGVRRRSGSTRQRDGASPTSEALDHEVPKGFPPQDGFGEWCVVAAVWDKPRLERERELELVLELELESETWRASG